MTAATALLTGLAVFVWCRPRSAASRLARLRSFRSAVERLDDAATGRAPEPVPVGERRQQLVAGLAGLATAVVVGGFAGVGAGVVVALVVDRIVRRLEPRAVRRHRDRLASDLPMAADLLGACLRVGRPAGPSVDAVARGVGGPLGAELALVAAALRLGADARVAWQTFIDDPALAPFGRAMVRTWDSGAPLATMLDRLADDARRSRRAVAERRARAVGVKAAAPLGLCFLPAFVLVGIVPVVVGAVSGLLR